MLIAPTPLNEAERLADLRSLRLLDTPQEERFDRIVRLAADVFGTPMAYIALIDEQRQWFKAREGVCRLETDRSVSFCGHTIMKQEPLIVPDALLDSRFRDNPMVVGEPGIRFYAGVPLRGPAGHNIATLCLADTAPREFSEHDISVLRRMGEMAERELQMVEVIEAQAKLLETQAELVRTRDQLTGELNEAARYVRSRLPAPVTEGPVRIDWRYEASSHVGGDAFGYHWVDESRLALYLLDVSGHGVGAALLSSSIHAAISSGNLTGADASDPASVITALDRAFPMDANDHKFFTCFYGVIDTGTGEIAYASAGHPPAYLITPDGRREALGATSSVVGISFGLDAPAARAEAPRGSRLYCFTDGAFEIPSPSGDGLLMPSGLAGVIEGSAGTPDRLGAITDRLREMNGGGFHDDYSLIELEFHGP